MSQFSNLLFCEFCFVVRRDIFVSVFRGVVFLVVTPKSEWFGSSSFFFFRFSIDGTPLASINSFVVVDSETQRDWCWSIDANFVSFLTCNSPLDVTEVEVNGHFDIFALVIFFSWSVVSFSKASLLQPASRFEVSFGDVTFSPSFNKFCRRHGDEV